MGFCDDEKDRGDDYDDTDDEKNNNTAKITLWSRALFWGS
jgi:hypothetical protein